MAAFGLGEEGGGHGSRVSDCQWGEGGERSWEGVLGSVWCGDEAAGRCVREQGEGSWVLEPLLFLVGESIVDKVREVGSLCCRVGAHLVDVGHQVLTLDITLARSNVRGVWTGAWPLVPGSVEECGGVEYWWCKP